MQAKKDKAQESPEREVRLLKLCNFFLLYNGYNTLQAKYMNALLQSAATHRLDYLRADDKAK